MKWTDVSRFVSDNPSKVTMEKEALERSHVRTLLVPAAEQARDSITLISPYFVPGEGGTQILVSAARSGRKVRVLTNSLVGNDVAAVHGGYSRWRRPLLEGGVELWELKPLPGSDVHASLLGGAGASLHTKALTVDGSFVFVGSFNIDPRSTWLNCEQGVLVEDTVLASQLETIFDQQCSSNHAWRVTLEDGKLRWTDRVEVFTNDPKATAWLRFQAWVARALRLDAQL
jgi:putative cardiolipin synthase